MTDFNNDPNGTDENVDQGNENVENDQITEQDQSQQDARTFTQEELDNIISERIAEVKNQSAAELEQLRIRAEETIANLSRAAASQQRFQAEDQQIEDDPPPIPLAQMTPNQRLLWESNLPNRLHQKKMLRASEERLSQSVAPVLNDQTVREFFGPRTYVPEAVKQATQNIFREARNNGNRAPADQLVQAAYTRALAEFTDNQLRTGKAPVTNQGQKKVIVKSPNGSADLGGSTRNITGKIGGSKTGSGKTYKQLMEELIAEGKMPDNGAGGHFSG